MRYRIAGCVVFFSLVLSTRAMAHFANATPASTNITLPPDGEATILLPTTFGAVISTDGGASFRWLCDMALDLGPQSNYDPDFAMATDGTIYASSTGSGLLVSRDGGCSFAAAAGISDSRWAAKVEIGTNGWVWTGTADGGVANDLYVSKDGGETFSAAGLTIEEGWFRSIKSAATDPQRIYVTGFETGSDGGAALLFSSADGGQTWKALPMDSFVFTGQPGLYLLGVSPVDPDVVFARVADVQLSEDQDELSDVLYRSTDGGQSWSQVLAMPETLTAFVIRKDGTSIIAGTVAGGVRLSADGGTTWTTPAQEPQMACVAEAADGSLYACGNNWEPDSFALASSSDGQTWSKILRFRDVKGPLECAAGTVVHDVCAPLWPQQCTTIGACPPQADEAIAVDAAGPPPSSPSSCGGCNVSLAAILMLPVLPWRRRAKGSRG